MTAATARSDVRPALHLQLALEALGLRVSLPALLWALPLDRALQALTPTAASLTAEPETLAAIESVTDLVTRHFRPTRTACLKRALMRYSLMRRRGYPSCFVIGVRPGGSDGFEAHAWVTLNGAPVMEREPVDYHSTFVWPLEQ